MGNAIEKPAIPAGFLTNPNICYVKLGETRRFIQEDTVKDGSNWYVYVLNNPITNIDPNGEYYIKTRFEDGTKYYYAEPQTTYDTISGAISRTLIDGGRPKGVVGGNSVDYDYSTNNLGMTVGNEAIQKILDSKFPKVAKVFGIAGTAYSIYSISSTAVDSYYSIQRFDSIIFKLFELADFTPETTDLWKLKKYMSRAYSFVDSFKNYFLTGAYSGGESYFWAHVKIKEAKDPEKKINSYYNAYYRYLSSANIIIINGEPIFSYKELSSFINGTTEDYRKNLRTYDNALTAFAEALKEYVITEPHTYFVPG